MQQMTRQWITIAVILLVLAGLGAASQQLANHYQAPNSNSSTTSTAVPSATVTKTIKYQGQDGKSVLDLLKANHQVETVDQGSSGIYVKSIDGTTQTDSTFWLYYIDGTIGDQSVDKAMTKNGQTIEWRYESF